MARMLRRGRSVHLGNCTNLENCPRYIRISRTYVTLSITCARLNASRPSDEGGVIDDVTILKAYVAPDAR